MESQCPAHLYRWIDVYLFILKISGLIKPNSDKFIGINNKQLKLLNKSCDYWSSNFPKKWGVGYRGPHRYHLVCIRHLYRKGYRRHRKSFGHICPGIWREDKNSHLHCFTLRSIKDWDAKIYIIELRSHRNSAKYIGLIWF